MPKVVNAKDVKEVGVFKKAISRLYQKGLKTESYNKALNSIGSKLEKQVQDSYIIKAGNRHVSTASEQLYQQAVNSKGFINKAASQSTKKISSNDDVAKRVKEIAKNKALVKSDYVVENMDDALSYYNKAVNAVKRQTNIKTAGNMFNSYFINPYLEQEYLTAGLRTGAGILGVGGIIGTGVIGSNIISNIGSYNNNYYKNLDEEESKDKDTLTY